MKITVTYKDNKAQLNLPDCHHHLNEALDSPVFSFLKMPTKADVLELKSKINLMYRCQSGQIQHLCNILKKRTPDLSELEEKRISCLNHDVFNENDYSAEAREKLLESVQSLSLALSGALWNIKREYETED